MELISTHLGADFDGFASMMAAQRLHPGARLFCPGSRQESLRRFLAAGTVEWSEVRQREIDPEQLRRVVLCDSRQGHRLGVLGEWIAGRPQLELVIYDHHPASGSDLEASAGLVDPDVGATSTLMTELFERQGIRLSPGEATLLLLGIYEDTGSLSFPTTSARDLRAAARLLELGADLPTVRRFAVHSMDAKHLDVLHRMTREVEVRRIKGHRVGIVALELGTYVDELAPLVSRCLDLLHADLLFALFGEGERVTIIARGELGVGYHLGEALTRFAAGGGHETAASASLRPATALEARERLLPFLERDLPPAATARQLMTSPFVSVVVDESVAVAKDRLLRRGINAAPVLGADGRAVGAVTRQLLDAAMVHGFGERPVEGVMETELEWVEPGAPAETVGHRMMEKHPRFVLVGDAAAGRPEGLVTRLVLLRHLFGELDDEAGRSLERRTLELGAGRQHNAEVLLSRLPPTIRTRVDEIAAVARELAMRAYLVGGLVRDLLLERENRDLDLVVEGDGPALARRLAKRLGGRVRVHEAFLTAVVIDPHGFAIDVATARSEFYREPAALPEVHSSALRQDLYRRDFTINTLAIRLGPQETPRLIDFFGGRRDLERGVIRVLHSLSFIDDPTRVLRAVRLEQRLGFQISSETLRLARVALGEQILDRLTAGRLRDELLALLSEPDVAIRGLERLDELGVLAALHPRLPLDGRRLELLRSSRSTWDWFRLEGIVAPRVSFPSLMLLALLWPLRLGDRAAMADRLALSGARRRTILEVGARLQRAGQSLAPGARASSVCEALAGLSGEELLLLMASSDDGARSWVRRFLEELRPLELSIRGRDLLRRGVTAGPAVGAALEATLAARRDGAITAEEELEYACGWLAAGEAGERSAKTGE